MKKILNFAAVAVAALTFASCESMLDTTNYWSKTTADFPATTEDYTQLITGIYNNLSATIGTNVHLNHFLWSNAASDDCFGGGGGNDPAMQAEDLMLNYGADMYNDFYCGRYKGIARANLAIEKINEKLSAGADEDSTLMKQYIGEAYFLRAWFYYELASMFGNIPCPITSNADATQPQISGVELWSQILTDLTEAIKVMPDVNNGADGHVDKYCAEALLGRAYLFASGFLGQSDFQSTSSDLLITKDYVAKAIKDCVENSGYKLTPKFQDNWAYTNRCTINDSIMPASLIPEGAAAYTWYEGDGGVNPEAMFVIKFNTQPSWSTTIGYSNQTALFLGVRGQSLDNGECFPFGTGWGMCPVSPQLVQDWKDAEPNDQRRNASIIDAAATWSTYKFGGDANIQESGYYQTKCMPVIAWSEENGKYMKSFSNVMYPNLTWSSGNDDNFQLNSINDMIMIRFAEVLLMDAELNNNQNSFDAVRTRAGLPSKAISEENIRNERRWELAFEGIRFNDLRRYGTDYAVKALDKQEGVTVYNNGVLSDNHASRFNGGYGNRYKLTNGFVPLPSSQISLSAGSGEEYKYKQNEGWGTADVDFAGWN